MFWPVAAGLFLLWLLVAFAIRYPWIFKLDLGSAQAPTSRYGYFAGFSMLFSVLAAAFMATGLARHVTVRKLQPTLVRMWTAGPDWLWIGLATVVAIAIPALIRHQFVGIAPLSNAERAFVYMAELLARGQLSAAPFPNTPHFQGFHLIHAGKRVVPEVLLAWPALMVPGVWIGRPELATAIVSGLGVVPVYLATRHLFGCGWARLAALLYIASPMVAIAAATRLPYTASMTTLAWMLWFVLRSSDRQPPVWIHAAVVFAFLFGLNIHPDATLGMGLPMLAAWLWIQLRRQDRTSLVAVASLVVVAGLGLLAFAALNRAQTGHPAVPGPGVGFLASGDLSPLEIWRKMVTETWVWPTWKKAAARLAMAGFRMNLALFGWGLSLAFIPFAFGRGSRSGLLWSMVVFGVAIRLFSPNIGMDIFGPAGYFELAVPLILLTVAGLRTLTQGLQRAGSASHPGFDTSLLPVCLVVASIVAAGPAYGFARLTALERMSISTYKPVRELRRARLKNAVVFGPTFYDHHLCLEKPTQTFVTTPPIPDLGAEVIWVPKKRRAKNLALMKKFPDRTGWVVRWTKNCGLEFNPLDRDSGREPFKTPGDTDLPLSAGGSAPAKDAKAKP